MNGNTNKISNILPQVQLLKSKYDKLAAVTGEHFNVFSILGVEADEVRTHSAFLADLLNPQGSHRQGTAFLKLFLEKALEYSGPDEYENFQVTKEASTEQGRIDILLEKNDACIVIENKIYADDQDAQMERYDQYAKDKGISEEQIKLVYLTLDGSPPSKGSLGKLPEKSVKCLSYNRDIINWLEECMKLQEVQRISSIREIVFQYRDLLKHLTGQSTNRRYSMELKDILAKDKNYEFIPELEEMILAFKVHVQFKFWEELKKQILELSEVDGWHETQDQDPSEDNLRHFYDLGARNRYVALAFYLESINWKSNGNSYDMALETGVNYEGTIFFGFILFQNGERVNYCKNEKFDDLAGILGNGFYRNQWWIGRKHSELNLRFPIEYSDSITEVLLDDGARRKLVQKFVTEIAAEVNKLKENLN